MGELKGLSILQVLLICILLITNRINSITEFFEVVLPWIIFISCIISGIVFTVNIVKNVNVISARIFWILFNILWTTGIATALYYMSCYFFKREWFSSVLFDMTFGLICYFGQVCAGILIDVGVAYVYWYIACKYSRIDI